MDNCIEFEGTRDRAGYGYKYFFGKIWRMHRLAWHRHHGNIPKGMFVCHHCDNPSCINIDHLFLGTHQDNMADMVSKGRQKRMFTPDQVREIREARKSGVHLYQLRRRYGMKVHALRRLLSGETYGDVSC